MAVTQGHPEGELTAQLQHTASGSSRSAKLRAEPSATQHGMPRQGHRACGRSGPEGRGRRRPRSTGPAPPAKAALAAALARARPLGKGGRKAGGRPWPAPPPRGWQPMGSGTGGGGQPMGNGRAARPASGSWHGEQRSARRGRTSWGPGWFLAAAAAPGPGWRSRPGPNVAVSAGDQA